MLDALFLQWEMTPRYAHISTIALPLTISLLTRSRLLTLIPFSVMKPFIESGQVGVLPLHESLELQPLGLSMRTDVASVTCRAFAEFLVTFHAHVD